MTTKAVTLYDRAAAMSAGNALQFNAAQFALIKAQCAPDFTDDEFLFFAQLATSKGLNPLAKEIYAWKQPDRSSPTGKKMIFVTSIDGFRKKAGESGRYNGRTAPEWMDGNGKWHEAWGFDKPPIACRVGVRIAGHPEPTFATVMFDEFVKDTPTWKAMPCQMIAKVAESHALRAAFPDKLSGLYTDDEFDKAGAVVTSSPGSKKVVNAAEMLDEPAPDVDQREPEPSFDVAEFRRGLDHIAQVHGWDPDEADALIGVALAAKGFDRIDDTTTEWREKMENAFRDPEQIVKRNKKRQTSNA